MIEPGRVVLDACTLENLAIVKRLDLLRSVFGARLAWTSAVEREIVRRAPEQPHLEPLVGADWLGDPIDFEDPVAFQAVDRIRRALGGSRHLPGQHLGEAQAIYYVSAVEFTAAVATDDQPAYNMARARGLQVLDTLEILRLCYARGYIGCPQAFELLEAMRDAGRGVVVPPGHWHVCPPGDPRAN